jgi:hypothetical protein
MKLCITAGAGPRSQACALPCLLCMCLAVHTCVGLYILYVQHACSTCGVQTPVLTYLIVNDNDGVDIVTLVRLRQRTESEYHIMLAKVDGV